MELQICLISSSSVRSKNTNTMFECFAVVVYIVGVCKNVLS